MQKVNIDLHKTIIGLCIGIFMIFTVYMAFNLKIGISPDSWYHLRVSQEYAKTFGIPENNPDTYQWRDISHIPYLYYWTNGRILNLNSITFNFNEAILLRIFNILYSLGTLIGVYLLSKEYIKNKIFQVLPLVLVSNTLMFLLLSSSINYDNLGNLFAIFSIYFFVKSIKNKSTTLYPTLMILMLLLGVLTKFTILPLAFILVSLIFLNIFKNRKEWKILINKKVAIALIPTIFFLLLNLLLYGSNLLQYHELTPSCEKVLTHEQCLTNGVYYRDEVEIPKEDVNLLRMVTNLERFDPISYSFIWLWEMIRRAVGIFGDSSFFHSIPTVSTFVIFYLIYFIYGITHFKKYSLETKYLFWIFFLYGLILLYVQNYDMYLKRGNPFLALQGRYIFPVIAPIYIFLALVWERMYSTKFFRILILISLVLFLLLSIPYFVLNVESWWFDTVIY